MWQSVALQQLSHTRLLYPASTISQPSQVPAAYSRAEHFTIVVIIACWSDTQCVLSDTANSYTPLKNNESAVHIIFWLRCPQRCATSRCHSYRYHSFHKSNYPSHCICISAYLVTSLPESHINVIRVWQTALDVWLWTNLHLEIWWVQIVVALPASRRGTCTGQGGNKTTEKANSNSLNSSGSESSDTLCSRTSHSAALATSLCVSVDSIFNYDAFYLLDCYQHRVYNCKT